MSIAADCPTCGSGNHDGHDRDWNITPGLIGGAYCDCTGDCAERNRATGDDERRYRDTWPHIALLADGWFAARAAAPDALRVRVEALHVAVDEMPFGSDAPVCAACGHLLPCPTLALLTDGASDPLRDRLQALCDAAMRNKWHLGAEAVSLTVAQVLAVVGEGS